MPDNVENEGGQQRCAGTTADGSPCRTPADLLQLDPEDGQTLYCFAHAPWLEQERALATRKGGLRLASKNRKHRYLPPDALPQLNSPRDAQAFAQLVTQAVSTGELSSAAGQAALKGLDAWLRAYEAGEVSERVAEIEQLLATKAQQERDAQKRRRDNERRHPQS